MDYSQNTIFVSIISYKDDTDEIRETINNLLTKAFNPKRIRIGLCIQTDSHYDFSEFSDNIVAIVKVDEKSPFGVSRARSILKDMCVDEDYFLQIDSHSDCTQNWDWLVIQDYNYVSKTVNNDKIILSNKHFMTHDLLGNKFEFIYKDNDKNIPLLYHNFRYILGVPTIDNGPFYDNFKDFFDKNKVGHLVKTQFLSAHFVFSGRSFIENFRMSHYIPFYGEEPELSLRLFCEGWDIYNYYERAIIMHDSTRSMHNKKWQTLQYDQENAYPLVKSYSPEKEVAKLFRYGKNMFVDVINKERSIKDFFDYHQVVEHRRPENVPEDFTDEWAHNKFKDAPGHAPYTPEDFAKEIAETNKGL